MSLDFYYGKSEYNTESKIVSLDEDLHYELFTKYPIIKSSKIPIFFKIEDYYSDREFKNCELNSLKTEITLIIGNCNRKELLAFLTEFKNLITEAIEKGMDVFVSAD